MPEKPLVPYKALKQKTESPHCGLDVPGDTAVLSAIPADAGVRGI